MIYRVPTVEEIRKVEPNGYTLASTFSGSGGTSLGFRMEGFAVPYASEFIPSAAATYRANWPETYVDSRDIREVTAEEILEKVGPVDVLEGSPPCASFSVSGKREAGWGEDRLYSEGVSQRSDDLFDHFIRILAGLQPKVVVAENVPGLIMGKARGYFAEILAGIEAAGYSVEARLLDGEWLGVPQRRKRIFIVGLRKDLDLDFVWPAPGTRVSFEEAVEGLPPVRASIFTGSAVVEADEAPLLEGTAIAGHYERAKRKKARYTNLTRGRLYEPSPTVTASAGSGRGTAGVVHPTEPRKYSIGELRRVCSYPDDFILEGTYAQQWERLGRSVPPLMARAVARSVRHSLDGDRILGRD